ncbi:tyrosine-type recombinase/integrase [Morganella morganii]|mgnify:CR=1 FL=1|uniref:tyrosine-type recombinase/integrase n=1 Tax=Morganella morganii TaxID=582 RepID=UPI0003DC96FE|nr:site-specific integrase [Morganella morganii]EJG2201550.1 site-specific integrase [Morganella morganii]ELN8405935.1 site-specific integrase [Morganella morganii]MBT0337408.1 site-specific integrase [Morganella morganii subsp. morganii]MBT0400422.1 site-specific integrase [Morganella morganii subsp. morganii]MDS0906563.1 site-specific integrase [Morganella morganii]
MSIKLRYGVWHCDFVSPSGKRIRRSLETSDKRQAQELHDQLKAEAWRVEKLGDYPSVTFDDACLRWLQEKEHKKSLDDDKTKIEYFLQFFSGKLLSSITETDILKATSGMINRKHKEVWEIKAASAKKKGAKIAPYKPKPATQATKDRYLAFLRSLFRAAVNDWKWIGKSPTIKVRQKKEIRVRWLTKEEATTLIQCMPDVMKPVVMFALATGLRRSNILNLEWTQIDLQRKVAWIHPEDTKGGKAIGVALNETACRVLRMQIGKHQQYVFVHTEAWHRADGSPTEKVRKMRVDDNTAWNTGLRRAGITNFRFHDLRHTWASWLVQAGVPLTALQEMGGWESIEMVQRYAHLAPNHLVEHARRIDEAMGINGTNMARALIKAV